jgi:chemotaxis protein methyltransferase CheR
MTLPVLRSHQLRTGDRASAIDPLRELTALMDRYLSANVTFADHSLATDSVFSETHLVSCRNVLIYFNRALQDRAIGLFREALVRRGFLGLGSKESMDFSACNDAFDAMDRRERLYRKR